MRIVWLACKKVIGFRCSNSNQSVFLFFAGRSVCSLGFTYGNARNKLCGDDQGIHSIHQAPFSMSEHVSSQ